MIRILSFRLFLFFLCNYFSMDRYKRQWCFAEMAYYLALIFYGKNNKKVKFLSDKAWVRYRKYWCAYD